MTPRFFCSGESCARALRAAFLKTSGPLQAVELAENFRSRDLAERD
jgi:hypothetical protein